MPFGFLLLTLIPLQSFAVTPDCAGAEGWPTSMGFVHLKNAGITDNNK
jgi:hypothetical protein